MDLELLQCVDLRTVTVERLAVETDGYMADELLALRAACDAAGRLDLVRWCIDQLEAVYEYEDE